jgi:hypothetical protein
VIDPATDTLISTIPGAYHSIVQAKDGSIWAIQDQKVVNIHPTTFVTTSYTIPTTKYLGSWGAWNAGSFSASSKQNVLYWINSVNSFVSGTQIVKFDVTTKTFNESFTAVPGQTGTYKQIPYVNGTITNTKTLNDYYWFPAMAVFPDNTLPAVSSTFPSQVNVSNASVIDLKTVVSDEDNLSSAIVKSIKSNSNPAAVSAVINANDELVLTPLAPGTADIKISFNSNGKVIEKILTVNSTTSTLATAEVKKIEFSIYPNPVTDILTLKTQEKILNVTIYDASGKSVNAQLSNGQINVSMLPNGVYILKAVTDKAMYQQKLIKK